MRIWLTEAEVQELTRRKQGAAQARKLGEAGIPFRMVDNRPVVLRSDVQTEERSSRKAVRLRLV
jgi:hypothetical protein